MNSCPILVTGVASDIGFGVGRLLRSAGWHGPLHGVDLNSDHAGTVIFDYSAVAPPASAVEYLPWLEEYADRHGIGLIIPTSEAEIGCLASNNKALVSGAKVLIANAFAVKTALDKHTCLRFLRSKGIPTPSNGIVGEIRPSKFPVVVKPRSGQGSKGVVLVSNESEFASARPGHIWQEYLPDGESEYTCPIYRSDAAGTRILILKRKLLGGVTSHGIVVEDDAIRSYVEAIAGAMELNGPLNVQLRLTPNGPRIFEANPRLSSTLVFRAKMGFEDLRWWLLDTLDQGLPAYSPPVTGTRFYRGSQEYFYANSCDYV